MLDSSLTSLDPCPKDWVHFKGDSQQYTLLTDLHPDLQTILSRPGYNRHGALEPLRGYRGLTGRQNNRDQEEKEEEAKSRSSDDYR